MTAHSFDPLLQRQTAAADADAAMLTTNATSESPSDYLTPLSRYTIGRRASDGDDRVTANVGMGGISMATTTSDSLQQVWDHFDRSVVIEPGLDLVSPFLLVLMYTDSFMARSHINVISGHIVDVPGGPNGPAGRVAVVVAIIAAASALQRAVAVGRGAAARDHQGGAAGARVQHGRPDLSGRAEQYDERMVNGIRLTDPVCFVWFLIRRCAQPARARDPAAARDALQHGQFPHRRVQGVPDCRDQVSPEP